jgi:tetratricopeptide (TPR) repeat protein
MGIRHLLFAVFVLTGYPSVSQDVLSRYESFFLPDDPAIYSPYKFEWNLPGKMQAFVNDGITEMSEGRFDRAVYAFSDAIAEMPSFAGAHYYRGISYKMLDSARNADRDLREAFRLAPDNPVIPVELARIYSHRGDLKTAGDLLDKAIAIDEKFVDAYFHLGNIAMKEGNLRKAINLYRRCNEINPSYPKALVQEGITTFVKNRRKNQEALALFDRAFAADSSYQPALFWRALVHMGNDKNDLALVDWDRLVKYNPSDNIFLFIRGAFYTDRGEFDKAFIDLKKIGSSIDRDENNFRGNQSRADRTLDIQFATTYLGRTAYGLSDDALESLKKGFCYLFTDNYPKATDAFRHSQQLQPSAVATFFRALVFEHSGKHDSAYHYYNQALAIDNDIFDAHKKRAIYRSELKDWKGAYKDFTEMERLEPTMKVTYRLRGFIRIHFKDYYGVILDMTKYIKYDTNDLEVYLMRAHAFEQVKDLKGANGDYRIALEKAGRKNRYQTYHSLIMTDLALGDTTHASQVLELCEAKYILDPDLRLLRIRLLIEQNNLYLAELNVKKWAPVYENYTNQKPSGEMSFLEGLMAFRLKNYPLAIRHFTRALKIDPEQKEARYFRGRAHLEEGKVESAIKDLRILAEQGYEKATPILSVIQSKN